MDPALTNSETALIGSPYDLRLSLSAQLSESDFSAALDSGECGFVHSFTTGSAVDGPGLRLVAWLTGCQFRCVYCHNPDTWKLSNGMPVTLSRAVEQLQKYRHELHAAHGGLTISGGEPLLQQDFVLKLFAAAKGIGIHTALDTNGYRGARLSDEDLNLIDLILLDLKAISHDLHHRLTDLDNEPVLEFARRLALLKRPVWVRFVFIPGWTDASAEVEQLASFTGALGNVERVDVLPFHQLGRFKWEKLGLHYELLHTSPPSRDALEEAVARFRRKGLTAY